MPLDFIPDFLMGFGLIDDIAVLGWTLSAIKSDIEAYVQWRLGTDTNLDTDSDA